MGFFSEIRELQQKQITLFVVAFLGLVACGFLVIFQFRPELIEKYDILKLTFLSISLMVPNSLFNIICFQLRYKKSKGKEPTFMAEMTGGGLALNAFIIFPPLVICYWFHLKFKIFMLIIAVLESLILMTCLFKRNSPSPN